MTLEGFSITDVSGAFKVWMKENSVFPTPADILKLARYEKHLSTDPTINWDPPAPPSPKAQKVQWAFKHWQRFTDDDKQRLAVHLVKLEEKAQAYITYLINHCGVPKKEFVRFNPDSIAA